MTSIVEFEARFPDDDACLAFLFNQRYGPNPPCPDCGRPAKWYRQHAARVFTTSCCTRRSLQPQGATLFHASRLPLRCWFYAMLLFANSRAGVRSGFLGEHLGICPKAALRMATQIRAHMTRLDQDRRLGGPGRSVRIGTTLLRRVRTDGTRGTGRIRLIGLADDQHAIAMPYAWRERPRLWARIHTIVRNGSILVTEDPQMFAWIASRLERSGALPSSRAVFDPSISTSDALDGFFLALKRWLRAVHLHVRRDGVPRYIGEFCFRYNRRSTPHRIFEDMISRFPDLRNI